MLLTTTSARYICIRTRDRQTDKHTHSLTQVQERPPYTAYRALLGAEMSNALGVAPEFVTVSKLTPMPSETRHGCTHRRTRERTHMHTCTRTHAYTCTRTHNKAHGHALSLTHGQVCFSQNKKNERTRAHTQARQKQRACVWGHHRIHRRSSG